MIWYSVRVGLALAVVACGPWAQVQATAGASSRHAAAGRQADERIISAGERAWGQAYVTGDIATAQRLLADDYLGVDPRGRTEDKTAVLSDVREEPHAVSDEVGPVAVRFYGDTAIAQAHERQVGPAPEFKPSQTVFTDTWVKLGGQWRIVAAEDLDPGAPTLPGYAEDRAAIMALRTQSNRAIAAHDLAKFARDLTVQLTGHALMRRMGIELVPVDAPTHFSDPTPNTIMIQPILGAVSQFEKAS